MGFKHATQLGVTAVDKSEDDHRRRFRNGGILQQMETNGGVMVDGCVDRAAVRTRLDTFAKQAEGGCCLKAFLSPVEVA